MEARSEGFVNLVALGVASDEAQPFAGLMRDFARAVQAEGSARQYEFHASWDDPQAFLLYEEFESEADWRRHGERQETRDLRVRIAPMLRAPVDSSVWRQFDATIRSDAAPEHTTLVKFRMKPQDVEPMLAEIRRDSATAAGLVRFDLNRGPDGSNEFLICARWETRSAWERHQTDADYLAFRSRTAPFYDGPPNRTLWRPMR